MRIYNKWDKFWEFGQGRMAIAAFCAHSLSISIGITQGYSAIWIPQLSASKEFNVSAETGSWLASLGAASNPLGSVLSGILAEYFGRRRSIQIATFPFILGWMLIGLAQNLNWLYAGRLITGIAGGMSTASYTYVGEISNANNRGLLNALGPVCASFGILMTYILGYLMSWKLVAFISIGFAVLSLVIMQMVPESPPHLLKTRGASMSEDSETYKAYTFFTRNIAVAQDEMKKAMENQLNNNDGYSTSLRDLYISPETIKPFCILVVLFLLQELSGIYTILFYAVSFFGEANLNINDYVSSIVVGSIRFGMSIVCAFLVNKYGRATLCTFSSFGMAVSVLLVGLYVKYYEINSTEPRILSMFPLFCIMANVFFSMFGMLPIPWILCGEMFPLRVRPIMSGVVICMAQTFIFVCVKIYDDMITYLKFSGTLFFFFVASILSMIFCKYILPETKNKSLDEIVALFRENKKTKNNLTEVRSGIENNAFSISSENIAVIAR